MPFQTPGNKNLRRKTGSITTMINTIIRLLYLQKEFLVKNPAAFSLKENLKSR